MIGKNIIKIKDKIKNMSIFFNNKDAGEIFCKILAVLVLVCGVVLIISATFPGVLDRLQFASEIFSLPFMKLSNRISLIIGFLLLGIFIDINNKVKRSFYWVSVLLALGGIFTIIKGFDVEEFAFLFFVFILLMLSKITFYRESYPINKLTIICVFIINIILMLGVQITAGFANKQFLILYNDYRYLIIHPSKFLASNLFSFFVAWLIILIYFSGRKKLVLEQKYDEKDEQRLLDFLREHKGNNLTHMLLLGDKRLFWSKNGRAVLGYKKIENVILVLGDPIGEKKEVIKIIEEFQRHFDDFGYDTAFFQVVDNNLNIYHDYGYKFFKLGEEAIVELDGFSIAGSQNSYIRNIISKFNKLQFKFEVMSGYASDELISRLKNISDEWLDGRKEKCFSMGFFDIDYIRKSKIALLTDENGVVMAFASLADAYDNETIAIDLMRYSKDSPKGIMDMLFISLILWAKENSFKHFSLSLAPLAGVGEKRSARGQEKLANLVYRYGHKLYNFNGLRRFKGKFEPSWEPRYLVYNKNMSLLSIFLNATKIDGKEVKI